MKKPTNNNLYLVIIVLLVGCLTGMSLRKNTQVITQSPALGYSITSTTCRTATSSTSPSWMTPGTATTTCLSNVQSYDSLRMYAWLIASSTQSHYAFLVSRSLDNVDYYQDGGTLLSTANATTTNLTSYQELSYVFASSTKETQINVNYNNGASGTTSAKLISFDIPTNGANYIKVSSYLITANVSGMSTSSENGAVWMEGLGTELHK